MILTLHHLALARPKIDGFEELGRKEGTIVSKYPKWALEIWVVVVG
jgi:hypothetical protein